MKNKKNNLIKKKYIYELLENGFSKKDIEIGKKVLSSKRITMASHTREFEKDFAKKIGAKYALMVNSGSSANLLATFAAGKAGATNAGIFAAQMLAASDEDLAEKIKSFKAELREKTILKDKNLDRD